MDLRKHRRSHYIYHYLAQAVKILLLGAIVLSTFFTANRIDFSHFFPISTVRVYGIRHVEPSDVQQLLTPLVRAGFFNTNIDYIRDQLRQMPWIYDISVKRQWPDQLDIILIEKTAVAYWNNDMLLSESGELFSPKRATYPPALPRLIGPDGQQIVMLSYFKDINRLLSPLHAKIASLELTSYRTWKLTLDNGIMLQIGHKDILTRLNHFVKVYPKIVGERAKDVEYIDLRYPNGVAVRWKAPLET